MSNVIDASDRFGKRRETRDHDDVVAQDIANEIVAERNPHKAEPEGPNEWISHDLHCLASQLRDGELGSALQGAVLVTIHEDGQIFARALGPASRGAQMKALKVVLRTLRRRVCLR